MWCAKCQADVAAIASADHQRANCSSCGAELLVAPHLSNTSPLVRDPRELLARWAQEDALDPLQHLPPVSANPPAISPVAAGRRPKLPPKPPQRRYDGQHPVQSASEYSTAPTNPGLAPAPVPVQVQAPSVAPQTAGISAPYQDVVIHGQHLVAGIPHFEAAALLARQKKPDRSGRWVTFAGQLAAYVGVGTLTVGASLVLMAYFGGPTNYAPAGWLITTAGQMLLFLGVVTLVSGGMEQTTQEVADRIDSLGAKILSIEEYRAQKAATEKKTDAA